MRIGIDARCLEEEEPTGVARYLRNLLREFCELAPLNEYILYLKNENIHDLPENGSTEQKVMGRKGIADNLVFEHFLLPRRARRDEVDVLFSPAYITPLWCRCPRVVTIHDISYELHPEWFTWRHAIRLRAVSRMSAKRATKIFTVSEYSKKEIVNHYRVPPEKVMVAHNGVDPRFKPSGDENAVAGVKQRYGIKNNYILHVGAILVRRNIPLLLSVFSQLTQKLPHQLILVGPNHSHPYQDISVLIREKGLEERVIWIQYASDEDLVSLYEGADLFVLLSSYEGFGFPVVEAMACGTPVVASNLTSLPEVVGNAGLLVDPASEAEVEEAILRVLTDANLRTVLAKKALERAKNFSWRKTAKKCLAAFEEVARE